MEPLWIVVPVFLILLVVIVTWTFRRSATILERWARGNGYQVLGRRWLMFGGKAFWWRQGRGHITYYVTVRDAGGRTRRAYVRCGSWPLGLLSDHVTVEWDD